MDLEQRCPLRAPRASPQTKPKPKTKTKLRSASMAAAADGTSRAAAVQEKPVAASQSRQQLVRDREKELPPLQPGWKAKTGALTTRNSERLLNLSKRWMSPLQYAKQQRFEQRVHVQQAFRKYNAGQHFLQERGERKKQQERKQRLSLENQAATKSPQPPAKPTVSLRLRKESKVRVPRKGMIFTLKPVRGGSVAARKLVILPEGIKPKPKEFSQAVPVWKGNPSLPSQLEKQQQQQRRAPKQLYMAVRLAVIAVAVVVLACAAAWNRSSPVPSASATTTVEFSPPTVSFGEETRKSVRVVPLEASDNMDASSDGLFFYTPVKVIPLNAVKDRVVKDNHKPLNVIRLPHSVPPMVKTCEVVKLIAKEDVNATHSVKSHHRPPIEPNATKSLESGGVILVRSITLLAREMVWNLIENVRSKRWCHDQDHQVYPMLSLDSNLTAISPSLSACKLRCEHPRKKRKRREQNPPLLDSNLTMIGPSLSACKLRCEHPRKKRKRQRREQSPPLLDLNSTTPSTSPSLCTRKLNFEHPRKKRKRRRRQQHEHKSPLLDSNLDTSTSPSLLFEHPRKKRKRREYESRYLKELQLFTININTSLFTLKLLFEHPRKKRKRKRRPEYKFLLLYDLELVSLVIPRCRSMKRPRKRKRWRCTSLSDVGVDLGSSSSSQGSADAKQKDRFVAACSKESAATQHGDFKGK